MTKAFDWGSHSQTGWAVVAQDEGREGDESALLITSSAGQLADLVAELESTAPSAGAASIRVGAFKADDLSIATVEETEIPDRVAIVTGQPKAIRDVARTLGRLNADALLLADGITLVADADAFTARRLPVEGRITTKDGEAHFDYDRSVLGGGIGVDPTSWKRLRPDFRTVCAVLGLVIAVIAAMLATFQAIYTFSISPSWMKMSVVAVTVTLTVALSVGGGYVARKWRLYAAVRECLRHRRRAKTAQDIVRAEADAAAAARAWEPRI